MPFPALFYSCIWVTNSSAWPRVGRRAGIEPVSYSSPDPNHWATPHPTKLSSSLLSYAAPYCATPLPAELRRTLLSYAAPCWATPLPADLCRTLLSYAAPYWATQHTTGLRCTLLETSTHTYPRDWRKWRDCAGSSGEPPWWPPRHCRWRWCRLGARTPRRGSPSPLCRGWPPPPAGLEKTRVKKNQPSRFFCFCFGFLGFLEFLYICPEERGVFRVCSASRIFLGASRL